MRSIACREFGPPDRLVLAEAPDPRPGPGQVLVGVRAAGVSFVDGLMVGGAYQLKPRLPFTPGLVAAGEVLEVGAGVSSVAQGSRVVSSSFDLGGYATHRVLPADAVVPLPDAVSFEVAASAVESYATILFALTRRATVRPGEWVLVLGAGGGIGLAAVDVARSLGAQVIAAASSQAKRAAAIGAGAQVAVDYQTEDLKARVREVTGAGADLVIDPVGDPFAEPALRSLRALGRHHPAAAAQPRPAGKPCHHRGRLGRVVTSGSRGPHRTPSRPARSRGGREPAPGRPRDLPTRACRRSAERAGGTAGHREGRAPAQSAFMTAGRSRNIRERADPR
jgi:NADPH2:quinone reductase